MIQMISTVICPMYAIVSMKCSRYHLAVPSPHDDHVRILVLGAKAVDLAVLGHVSDLGETSASASKGKRRERLGITVSRGAFGSDSVCHDGHILHNAARRE